MQRSSSPVRTLAVAAAVVVATGVLAGCGTVASPGPVVVASSPAGTPSTGRTPGAHATPGSATPGARATTGSDTASTPGTSTPGTGTSDTGTSGTGTSDTGTPGTGAHRGGPGTSSSPAFPAGQPPRPGRQDRYPDADTVPGLAAAVRAAGHPGLQICGDDLASLVTASGDLRGDGGRQYLVDTTCTMATSSSPDEVALYDVRGGRLVRSAVLSEFTANRPEPSAYPYLWQRHTVVLPYEGDRYRLVQLTPDTVTPGLVESFR